MVQGSPFSACMERVCRRAQTKTDNLNGTVESGAFLGAVSESTPCSLGPRGEAQAEMGCPSVSLSGQEIHRVHNVLTISARAKIVKWMMQEVADNGDKYLFSKTVRQFPEHFRASPSANNMRAMRLWRERMRFINDDGDLKLRGTTAAITRVSKAGRKTVRLKAKVGRGRKRQTWVDALHRDLLQEFERLSKLGVKFNLSTLKHLALNMLRASESPDYSANMTDARTDAPLHTKITLAWVQGFKNRYRIVSRAHTGKHRMSPAKEEEVEIEVAAHLGNISGLFAANKLEENDVENADETHFVINVDNGRTLGFCGSSEVKYADVVSGGDGFTMLVRLSGGRDSRIEYPFIVFRNKDRNYPIRGVPDTVDGVAYRTGPKGWIDTTVMPQWLSEIRVIRALPQGRKRILFLDNCSGHTSTPALTEACSRINTEIRYFPPNATHLIQPCDSFVIQKIKRQWTTEWETYKMDMIRQNRWKDSAGKIANPGKTYFLRLAARCVRVVNLQRDADGLSYARKAMIITGLALNTNGIWEKSQLTPELQRIITKHQAIFDASRLEAMQSE